MRQYLKSSNQWQDFLRIALYTLVLFLVQAVWVSRLPYPAMRVDLLLPLMLGVAMKWPPLLSLFWALSWGYVADAFSGEFWGFHVGSYVASICLVHIASEKFEFRDPIYVMGFAGLCAVVQSLMLALFLLFQPSAAADAIWVWKNLAIRSVLIMLLSPFIIHPVWKMVRESV